MITGEMYNQVMKSALGNQLGLDSVVDRLQKQASIFGVSETLTAQIEACLQDYTEKANEWADRTQEIMSGEGAVPVQTGALRDSLVVDIKDYPRKTFVGVNTTLLSMGPKYPGFDYTEDANWYNALGMWQLHFDFINEVWFEIAHGYASDIFGKVIWKKI